MSPSEEWRAKWRAKIRASQEITHYLINGRTLPRIRYGGESSDWHADEVPCHDCGVVKGQFHVPHCDVEECLSVVARRLSSSAGTVPIRVKSTSVAR
jgi:hypothetical protein